MADFLFFENGDGGDCNFKNGDISLDNTLFTSIYLSHFGGNKEAITQQNLQNNDFKKDWFGNVFVLDKEELQLNSRLEKVLRESALNSLAPDRIKNAIKADLNWMKKIGMIKDVEISVFIISQFSVKIIETIIEKNDNKKEFSYIWDKTKNAIISPYLIPKAEAQTIKILSPSENDYIVTSELLISYLVNNVYSVNVGLILDDGTIIYISQDVKENASIEYPLEDSYGKVTLFVENADFTEIRDEISLFIVEPRTIAITQPSPLEHYNVTDLIGIDWSTTNVSKVKIDLVKTINGVETLVLLDVYEYNEGPYEWPVYSIPPDPGLNTIRVSVVEQTQIKDEIQIYIDGPYITFPVTGGEIFLVGDNIAITWNEIADGRVQLSYFFNEEETLIDEVGVDDFPFNWSTSELTAGAYLLRSVYVEDPRFISDVIVILIDEV